MRCFPAVGFQSHGVIGDFRGIPISLLSRKRSLSSSTGAIGTATPSAPVVALTLSGTQLGGPLHSRRQSRETLGIGVNFVSRVGTS